MRVKIATLVYQYDKHAKNTPWSQLLSPQYCWLYFRYPLAQHLLLQGVGRRVIAKAVYSAKKS